MAEAPYILHFRDLGREARSLVGGKSASLGSLLRAGARVPSGFAVTTHAYQRFLEDNGLRGVLRDAVAALDSLDTGELEGASRRARQLIESAPLPDGLARALRSSYELLAQELGTGDAPVAVRSSATSEDSVDASFAGQQDTYLWVRGQGALAHFTVRCWSSLYAPHALAYRARLGYPLHGASMGVAVQSMVDARVAGVMFTLNPTTGDQATIVIEASWGLGTSVVGGEVTPDEYWVEKVTLEVLRRTIAIKATRDVAAPGGGVAREAVPPDLQGTACLTDEEVRELARLGKAMERDAGSPQDIEWAIDRRLPFPESVLLLQCRPETVWSRRSARPLIAPRATVLDYVTDAILARLKTD
jgi:phosphoenolpyruvate synthase/pyruvate phosphate dikinase